MKVALIGYGYWGKIIERYLEQSEFELKFIYNKNRKENPKEVDTLEIIWNDLEIRAVFICTPVDTHYILCKLALEHGKHVFCEKPTVKNLDEFNELYSLAYKNKKILYTDYIYMVSPSINYIKNIYHEIGKILYIRGEISQFGNFYENDTVYEVLGVHLVSAISYITGDTAKEINYSNYIEIKKAVTGNIKYTLTSGGKVEIFCNLIGDEKIRKLMIWGESGYIEFNMNSQPNVKVFFYNKSLRNSVSITKVMEKCFDEKNGIKIALSDFKQKILKLDNTNMNISKEILKILLSDG
ncbi:MAG: Gfo/Idh/MocA family oxidoreductase [Clostridiales bacterium]|nr:Gfo/Idh/MocA family oxidoreductase [Clostridiales bacterium]